MGKPVNHYGIIYCGKNTVNGKLYIGQTTSTLQARTLNHKSKPPNIHLKRAFQKYGFEAFTWAVIDHGNSEEELNRLETYYIRAFETTHRDMGYNCREGGSQGKLSEDTKLRIARSKTGIPLSDVHRLRISEAKKGHWVGSLNPRFGKGESIRGANNPMYGKKHSAESKLRMSIGKRANPTRLIGKSNPMYGKLPITACSVIVHRHGKLVGKFESIRKAATHLNISQPFAARLATGNRISRDGLSFRKIGGPERSCTSTPFGTRS